MLIGRPCDVEVSKAPEELVCVCTTCVLKSNFQPWGVLVRAAFKRYVSRAERFFLFDKETFHSVYLL